MPLGRCCFPLTGQESLYTALHVGVVCASALFPVVGSQSIASVRPVQWIWISEQKGDTYRVLFCWLGPPSLIGQVLSFVCNNAQLTVN